MQSPQSEPAVGSTLATVRARASALAPSERRVADVCLARPREVAWWSAADLAEHASTSTATVVRACQNLGFTGFQHLRMLLLRDLGGAVEGDASQASPDSGMGLMRTVFEEVARDLGTALAPLDEESFDAAVTALARARRVLVVGNGGASAPCAGAVAFRFVLNGRPAEAPVDAVVQQLTARHLSDEDVCLAISDSGMNAYTLEPVEAARSAGATVVGVTGHARSTLVDRSDIALVVGGAGPYSAHGVSSTVVMLTFLIGLQVAVSRNRDGSDEAAEASLKQVVTLLNPKE
ncbi:MurR/RpiR family transcriptional regulator [Rhodococcus sp. NPDC003318]|uniref:MurR/RpiR family transcriptional regulator n=1 Tax=Rhodococcus sp. NPDC003318 TaxID=3364503 RepID=UPI00369CCB10